RTGARRQQYGAAEQRSNERVTEQQQLKAAEGGSGPVRLYRLLFPRCCRALTEITKLLWKWEKKRHRTGVGGWGVRRQPDSRQHEEEPLRETGAQDSVPQNLQPEKVGWIRKFCGRGIFREIWKNRFVVLKGDQLFICEKEVKELGRADEVLDLTDYEHCEEIRKNKTSNKLIHANSKETVMVSYTVTMVPNLVFLAVSPEEKESWIHVLNAAITRAKNRILDEVTVDDSQLCHLTRDRVKIPHNRRLPTRGHLLAVASASSSDGTLTLDLIQEEDSFRVDLSSDCPRSKTDSALSTRTAEASGKSQSLPREVPVIWEKTGQTGKDLTTSEKSRCASMDEILSHSENKAKNKNTSLSSSPASLLPGATSLPGSTPISQLQELISQKLQQTERLLKEVRAAADDKQVRRTEAEPGEAERLLKEAAAAWTQAHEVLEEVKELQALYQQLDSSAPISPSNSTKLNPDHKSLM
ncbi:hypothetical protein INR49_019697, partial [Caranx melampygus]